MLGGGLASYEDLVLHCWHPICIYTFILPVAYANKVVIKINKLKKKLQKRGKMRFF